MRRLTNKDQTTVFLANRVQNLQLPVFREIGALATKLGAINLGGGTPDFPAPVAIKEAAVSAIQSDCNQYALSQGVLELRNGIAKRLAEQQNVTFDPETEITICSGATEGIAASLLAVINPEDEVIILEPAFTIYGPDVVLCGGKPVYVPLRAPYFRIHRQAIEDVITPRTKAILINSPHNPTGRVFDLEELTIVADLCKKYNLLAITDEIYDEIVFNDANPPRLWKLAGMRERTVIVNGFSKTYSITGWRLGYVVAPPELTKGIRIAHNYLTISAAAPLQQAAVEAIAFPDSYYQELRAAYKVRRDLLLEGLERLGIPCFVPEGGYFLLADFSHFLWEDDVAFSKHLVETLGVAAVPLSGFYHTRPKGGPLLLRFAFCKTEDTLRAALARLEKISLIERRPKEIVS